MIDFESRLKALRLKEDMSQKDLAIKLGLTKATISAYEKGSRKPSYEVLINIAKVYKVSTDYLLGLESEETSDQINLSGLTPDEKNAIKTLIEAIRK